jgi:RHS repeat-associated protein
MAHAHSDHLGTPQIMTDGAAATVWDASYRPFGETTAIACAAVNQQRLPGQTADPETGYYDNWHRTYDPSIGRYLQSDPIGLAGGWNTFAYANGNPVMLSDPTGQAAPLAIGGGFVFRAGLGGGIEAWSQFNQCGYIYDPDDRLGGMKRTNGETGQKAQTVA